MNRLRHWIGATSTSRLWVIACLLPYLCFGLMGEAGHTHNLPHLDCGHHGPVLIQTEQSTPAAGPECLQCQWLSQGQSFPIPVSIGAPVVVESYVSFVAAPATLASRAVETGVARGPPSYFQI